MPRLELEVSCDAGPVEQPQICVSQGTSVIIGRLPERADVAFPSDLLMSSCHLKLAGDAEGFSISDLRSTNGTFVNGVRLQGARRLVHGDEIAAGQTRFLVRLAGDPTPTAVPDVGAFKVIQAAGAPLVTAGEGPIGRISSPLPPCIRKSASPKVQVWQNQIFEITPVEVTHRLRAVWHAYLLLDEPGAPLELSPSQIEAATLPLKVDGATAGSAVGRALLLAPESEEAWQQLIEHCWNQDAMVCLFSDLEEPSLRSRLGPLLPPRSVAASEYDGLGPMRPAPGLPGRLRQQLRQTADVAAGIFDVARAVLLESPQPEYWTLYVPAHVEPTLSACGFSAVDG